MSSKMNTSMDSISSNSNSNNNTTTEYPALAYAAKDVLVQAVQMLLDLVNVLLQILFQGIVDLNVAFATAILTHPQVKTAGAQIIVEGMNAFVTQPDLNETMQVFSDTMAKGQEDFALKTGQDFPKLAGKFFEGMFSKESKDAAAATAQKQQQQQDATAAAANENDAKKFFHFIKQQQRQQQQTQQQQPPPPPVVQVEPEKQAVEDTTTTTTIQKTKSEDPPKAPPMWGLPGTTNTKDSSPTSSRGKTLINASSNHSTSNKQQDKEVNAPLKFLEGVFGKKPKTTTTAADEQQAPSKDAAAPEKQPKTSAAAGKENNTNTKTTEAQQSSPFLQKKPSSVAEEISPSSSVDQEISSSSSSSMTPSSSQVFITQEQESRPSSLTKQLLQAANDTTAQGSSPKSPPQELNSSSSMNRSPSPVLSSLWGSPFRRSTPTASKSPVAPSAFQSSSSSKTNNNKSPVVPMLLGGGLQQQHMMPQPGDPPLTLPTEKPGMAERKQHSSASASPAPEHAQPEADLILLPNFQNMGPVQVFLDNAQKPTSSKTTKTSPSQSFESTT